LGFEKFREQRAGKEIQAIFVSANGQVHFDENLRDEFGLAPGSDEF
jgi:hypothetical protein